MSDALFELPGIYVLIRSQIVCGSIDIVSQRQAS